MLERTFPITSIMVSPNLSCKSQAGMYLPSMHEPWMTELSKLERDQYRNENKPHVTRINSIYPAGGSSISIENLPQLG